MVFDSNLKVCDFLMPIKYRKGKIKPMRKIYQSVTILSLAITLLISGWTPAFALANSLTLDGVTANSGGVVLHFTFDGNLSKSQMKGSVQTESGDTYPLSCWKLDDHSLRCTTSKKVAGQDITVFLAGYVFYSSVPNLHTPSTPAGYSCPMDGLAQVNVTLEISDGSFYSSGALGPVTAGQQIDINAYVNAIIFVYELFNAPLTVVGWTLDSVQCWPN